MSTPELSHPDGVATPAGPQVQRLSVVSHQQPDAPLRQSPRVPEAPRGQLVAVCGLCGGAGASTLTFLLGLSAVRRRRAPVLVCDTGGLGGGLADYAGVAAPRSLLEIAEQLGDGVQPGRLYVTTGEGVRVLATGPRLALGCAREEIELLLSHARGAHALTVIDCGTLAREADQVALRMATHVAWVVPATPSAVHRGERVLEAINPYLLGRQMLVARRDEREPKAALRDLKRLAGKRDAPLILLPHLPDLVNAGRRAEALEAAQVPLQAIHGLLAR
jgi:MinD-like ATPase involved in chromosome partitioning or flagellar assembly